MKRLMSILLLLALLISSVGCMEGRAYARQGDGVNEPLSKLMTMSDFQKWTSDWKDDWDFLDNQFNGIVDGAYNAGASPDYMLFGGDFSCLGNIKESSEEGKRRVLEIVQNAWPNLTEENYVLIQGNHDPADTDGISPTGPYYFDDFIIYVVDEDDFPTKQGSEDVLPGIQKTAGDLKKWLNERAAEHETRPILIASHTGLHYDIDRKDGNNQYAYVMFDAINEAAKSLDVVFFFGHNHTNGDEQVGGSLTFYQRDDKLNICTETSIANKMGTPSTLNFTYMNYGYIGYIGDITNNPSDFEPTNVLTVSQLSFYNDRIEVARYSKDGLLEDYSRTIERKHNTKETKEPKKYEVYYEARGGEVPVTSDEILEGTYIINRQKPVRNGYTFKGYIDDDGNAYEPGDEITVQSDVTLKAKWEKNQASSGTEDRYTLTDTVSPGKRYIMVWNSDISGNSGKRYALTADGDAVKVTNLDGAYFTADGLTLTIPKDSNKAEYQWDAIWNQGENEARGYLFTNASSGKYLSNKDSKLSLDVNPAASSEVFKADTWNYGDYQGYNQLSMYNDSDKFLRYSVSGGNMKLGTKSTATDVNNSSVFLYEMNEKADYRWEKADSLEPGGEYLVVNSDKAGDAKALTVTKRDISTVPVTIKNTDGKLSIDYKAEYNNSAVIHAYSLGDNAFWLDTWNAPDDSEALWLGDSQIKVTSNHADSRYYFRFSYNNGALSAKEGYDGTDSRKLVYKDGSYTVGDGDGVYLFKRTGIAGSGTGTEQPADDTGAAKSELKAYIEDVQKILAELNSEEVNKAVDSARSVLDAQAATEDEIYDAMSTLRKAVRKAKLLNEENSNNSGEDNNTKPGDNGNNTTPGNNSNNSNVNNGGSQATAGNNAGSGTSQPQNNAPGVTAAPDNSDNVGKTFTHKNIKYKITKYGKDSNTVMVTGTKKKLSSVNIPAAVKYKGVTYKVTAIGKKAFKGMKTLKKVTIGKNVKSIGAKAFSGCRSLKLVKIKSKALKKAGKNVFGKQAVVKR